MPTPATLNRPNSIDVLHNCDVFYAGVCVEVTMKTKNPPQCNVCEEIWLGRNI